MGWPNPYAVAERATAEGATTMPRVSEVVGYVAL